MPDDERQSEPIEEICDDAGRFAEPDGQMLCLGRTDEVTTWVLMPTADYVRTRSLRYRKVCTAAVLVAALGCLVHWLVVRPETPDGYVITAAFVALAAALSLRIWNATIRAGLLVRAGRRVDVRIATVKFTVHPMLGERLGLELTDDGRTWRILQLDPEQRRLRLMLHHRAFPALPEFLDRAMPEAWTDLRTPDETT